MAIVVGIKFKSIGKVYYFSPKDIEFSEGDGAITETVRGVEYGNVVMSNRQVDDKEIVSPLKEVIRKATEEDTQRHLENLSKRGELIKTVNEKVKKHELTMKIVDAEYTFDISKVIVYFTAEGRVDFRELVKDLASVYHLRIELRQIYERDDIKMRGALGPCGRPCCCATHLQDFEKVSIKMAKIQGLSLNPSKISGCCGKLMCCLKYENDYYKKTYKKMPKVNSTVTTPDGEGTVMSNDILRLQTKVKINFADDASDIRTYPLDQVKASSTQEEIDDDENGRE